MMTPPTPRAAQPLTASRMPARGIASAAQSILSGSADAEFTQAHPLISWRVPLTKWISPRYAKRSRLASRPAPSEPGEGEAPTIAIDCGLSMRPIADRAGVRVASSIALVSAEPGPKTLFVQELFE